MPSVFIHENSRRVAGAGRSAKPQPMLFVAGTTVLVSAGADVLSITGYKGNADRYVSTSFFFLFFKIVKYTY